MNREKIKKWLVKKIKKRDILEGAILPLDLRILWMMVSKRRKKIKRRKI